MTLGFIGTGGITEAIVTGLYNHGGYQEDVLVSERNQARSKQLANQFSKVSVIKDNQSIVDRSEVIVISVLPEQALPLLTTLRFDPNHRIISLPAGIRVETLVAHVDPATKIYRAIPMPPIAHGLGATPIYPPDAEVETLFARVGQVVPVKNERWFTALGASSAVMATFFAWIASNARWLESQGVPAADSARYATSVFQALATMAMKADPEELQRMSAECITPGGLNEQVLTAAQRAGVIKTIQAEIDRLMIRLDHND